jgi:glutathione S-transferase
MQCLSKKTTPTLFCNRQGAPSRMVLLTIQNLGIKVDLQYIDTSRGEQNNPEFVKLNPLHQVPVLKIDEQNFSLPESKAIMIFLASVGKSSFYPTDVKKRALVDARLFFDASSTSPTIRNFVVRKYFKEIIFILKNLKSSTYF